jgi:chaperonin cofactor prefoldin
MSYRSWRYPGTGQPYGYPPMTGPSPWMWLPSPYGYPPYQPAQTPEAEMGMLEQIREQLEGEREAISKEIEGINARIEELKKMMEEGTPQQSAPSTGQMPFWGLGQYGPMVPPYPFMPAPEQEKQMLEQQVKVMEDQIEAIRKRLDELGGG